MRPGGEEEEEVDACLVYLHRRRWWKWWLLFAQVMERFGKVLLELAVMPGARNVPTNYSN